MMMMMDVDDGWMVDSGWMMMNDDYDGWWMKDE